MNKVSEAIDFAIKKALETGYDQIIYVRKTKILVRNKSEIPYMDPRSVIGYIILSYKDGSLQFRLERGEYRIRKRDKRREYGIRGDEYKNPIVKDSLEENRNRVEIE